jgi:hemerythrin
MRWDAALETGIPVIDAQHKDIVRKLGILLRPEDKDGLAEVFAFLSAHITLHFQTEQEMHEKTAYPFAERHRQAHVKFTATYTDIQKHYEETGYDVTLQNALYAIVMDWLLDHLMGEDKEFARYYKTVQG